MTESLSLKWGTVKGWFDLSEKSLELMRQYFGDGVPMSAMADRPDDDRKAILCKLIDQFTGEIQNDWSGEKMSKDDAKKYVTEYGTSKVTQD